MAARFFATLAKIPKEAKKWPTSIFRVLLRSRNSSAGKKTICPISLLFCSTHIKRKRCWDESIILCIRYRGPGQKLARPGGLAENFCNDTHTNIFCSSSQNIVSNFFCLKKTTCTLYHFRKVHSNTSKKIMFLLQICYFSKFVDRHFFILGRHFATELSIFILF